MSFVLTFSHEIIRTGKGALGGREVERRVVVVSANQHPVSRKKSKTRKKSKNKIESLKVVEGLRPNSGKKTQG